MKIIIPIVVIMVGAAVTAGWKLYDNMHAEVRDLQEKVGDLAIVVNITNLEIGGMKPKIESTMAWAQNMDKNVDRIKVRLGIADPIGDTCPSDSARYANGN